MDPDVHDDPFDDVDFDHNTLDELERLSTQRENGTAARENRPVSGAGLLDASRAGRRYGLAQPPSSDYGFEDEDVIDLDARPGSAHVQNRRAAAQTPDEVTQREHWRLQRYGTGVHGNVGRRDGGQVSTPFANQHTVDDRTKENGENGPGTVKVDKNEGDVPMGDGHDIDVKSLQARIAELERERVALQRSAEDAHAAVLSKAGEISIVRANHDKATKEYERRIAVLQKLHADEASKAKAEIDATKKEREKMETSNRFLEHDLAQEAERARNIKKTFRDGHDSVRKTRTTVQPSPLSTPRKDKGLPLRDGFEDDEVVLFSPSRAKERTKPATPKAGGKRKRVQGEKDDSPSPAALSFSAPRASIENDDIQGDVFSQLPHREIDTSDEKFEVLQTLLNHRSLPDRERTFEALSKFSYPSLPSKSISSILYDHIVHAPVTQGVDEFRAHVCDILMSQWAKCLEEKFYGPLYDLTEFLQYILILAPSELSTSLIHRLVPLCQNTADLVALPIAKALKNPLTNHPPSELLRERIGPLDYLNLLHLAALNCLSDPNELTMFWSAMEFDFVLLMLHKAQPLPQMMLMLQLLFTSILPHTFGAIVPGATASDVDTALPARQGKMESDILDRLTVLLFETPEPQRPPTPTKSPPYLAFDFLDLPGDDEVLPAATPYTPSEILTLRTTVLTLLFSLSQVDHGGVLLSTHRLFLPRLIRFLHDSILAMYAYFPSSLHEQRCALVNTCVRLLHHLTLRHGDVLDVRAKLANVSGGPQRYLVSLARIAFAEGYGVVEQGVEAEVAEMAHAVLDGLLSPEEGESVMAVFGSGKAGG